MIKASPWQAGWAEQAGGTGQLAAQGFRGRQISSLTSFPLVSLCAGGGSERERGGGKAFKEDSGGGRKKKAKTPSHWISNCLSREAPLRTSLGFREKGTRAGAGAGAWKEGAEGPGPGSCHLGAGAKDKRPGGQRCGSHIKRRVTRVQMPDVSLTARMALANMGPL